jgi:hypothetical protein
MLTRPVKTQASCWASVRYNGKLSDCRLGPTQGALKPAKNRQALPKGLKTCLPDPSKLKHPAGPRSGTTGSCQTVGSGQPRGPLSRLRIGRLCPRA